MKILVRVDNAGMATNVGGSVETTYKTFDVELPDVEQYLRDARGTYSHANVIGVELLEPNAAYEPTANNKQGDTDDKQSR